MGIKRSLEAVSEPEERDRSKSPRPNSLFPYHFSSQPLSSWTSSTSTLGSMPGDPSVIETTISVLVFAYATPAPSPTQDEMEIDPDESMLTSSWIGGRSVVSRLVGFASRGSRAGKGFAQRVVEKVEVRPEERKSVAGMSLVHLMRLERLRRTSLAWFKG